MSKYYEGWEIVKMLQEGRLKENDLIESEVCVTIKVANNGLRIRKTNEELTANDLASTIKYKLIQKPVTFEEVLNSNKNCRIEHKLLVKTNNHQPLAEIMKSLATYCRDDILRKILKEGEWFLESDEQAKQKEMKDKCI